MSMQQLSVFLENKPGTPGIGMEVGANSEANAQKFQIYAISKANFEKLTATIASSAVAWPEGGALEAGKWYAYTVAANGSYTIDTDDLNKVLYTLDGSILARDDEQVTTTLQSTMELAAGLPEGVEFAHKTGCADDIYHDGGVVYMGDRDYIISLFTAGFGDDRSEMMAEISRYVYEYEANLF